MNFKYKAELKINGKKVHSTVELDWLKLICNRLCGQAKCGVLTRATAYDTNLGRICETENVIERSYSWDESSSRYDVLCKWLGTAEQSGEVNTVMIFVKDSENNYHMISTFEGLSESVNANDEIYIEYHLYIYPSSEDKNASKELADELTDPSKEKIPSIDKVQIVYQDVVQKTLTGKSSTDVQPYDNGVVEGYDAIIEFLDESTDEYSWDKLRFIETVDNVLYYEGDVTPDSKAAEEKAKFRLRVRNVRPK